MATILKFRRFTTDNSNFIGNAGELTVDTDKKTVRVHDGATVGGSLLATETFVNTRIDYVRTSYSTTQEVETMDATVHTLANQYTDARETAIRSTLTTSLQDYNTSLEVDGKISTALQSYDTSTTVDTKISTAVSDVIGGAPGALNTLNELAASLNNDDSYATTITNALALKANASDVTTSLALKANASDVTTSLALKAPLASPALTGTPTVPTASSSTNTQQIASTAFVKTVISETMTAIDTMLRSLFPTGIITIWKGTVASIPAGYVLCDGTNGTPDLRNSFVPGAGDQYSPGDVGGADSKTLTIDELPSHTHTPTLGNAGAHQHFVANGDIAAAGAELTTTNTLADTRNVSTSYSYNLGGTDTAASMGLSSTAGDHTHSLSIESVGGGQSFDIRPKYYALCYIMKVWA